MTTYLTHIADHFRGLQEPVNTRLTTAGLAPLVKWHAADPLDYPRTGTPYGWFAWSPEPTKTDLQPDGTVRFSTRALTVVALAAPDQVQLDDLVATWLPAFGAAVESQPHAAGYNVYPVELGEIASESGPHFALWYLEWLVTGVRYHRQGE